MSERLIEGQLVKATTTFKDDAGHVFDPVTVRFNIEDGNGGVATYEDTTRATEGVYSKTFALSTGGTWWYRNEGLDAEGKVVAVDQGPFEVESRRPFP